MRATPRFATKRDRRWPSYGRLYEAENVTLTGSRFMPWQRQVSAVAGEYDPRTGLLRRRVVIVKIPRQQGKSQTLKAALLGRGYAWSDQQMLYLAQDRNMARHHVIDDLAMQMSRPYSDRHSVRLSNGAERVVLSGGSTIAIDAVTMRAGHGRTLDEVVLDEVWALQNFNAIQSMNPAMITRTDRPPGTQMWVVSTEGVEGESPVLDYYTELGRASVTDPFSNVAYFEYSAAPDDDIYDEVNWWKWLPALGFTVTIEAVRHLAETMPPDEFARAMCNRKTKALHSVFPPGAWDACGDLGNAPSGGLSASVDITPDRSRAFIAVCGGGCVEIIEDQPGTDWIVPRMIELDARWAFDGVAIDNQGPAVSVIGELEMHGLRITKVNSTEMKSACGRMYDAVMSQQLRHRKQPVLDDAAAAVQKRTLLDAFGWSRRGSVNISPFVAATLAYWCWAEVPSGALAIY